MPVAEGDGRAGERTAVGMEHDGVGRRDGVRDALGLEARPAVLGGGREGAGRHDRDDLDPFALEPVGEPAAVRLVRRDEDLHRSAPVVGTTERADSAATAASTAATSDRGMTSSSAAEPPPIIESSRVTETTVASGMRMRGVS